MGHFERLSIRRFRRLVDVDLELRPLNVLIGANGIGKTSILDVLSLLEFGACALNTALSDLSGLPAIVTNDMLADGLELEILMRMPNGKRLEYLIHLEHAATSFRIEGERLLQFWPSCVAYKLAMYWSGDRLGMNAEPLLEQIPDFDFAILASISLAAGVLYLPQDFGLRMKRPIRRNRAV